MNRKAIIFGWGWIGGFFLFLILFLLAIGFVDIVKVEFFDPVHQIIRNETINVSGSNTSVYVANQDAIRSKVEDVQLPWNYALIIITGMMVGYSIIDSAKRKKQSIFQLLLGSTAGMIFLIYVLHLFIIGMIDWLQLEVIGYLFADLIDTEVPFYNTLYDNWWWGFVWLAALNLANRFFGKEDLNNEFA